MKKRSSDYKGKLLAHEKNLEIHVVDKGEDNLRRNYSNPVTNAASDFERQMNSYWRHRIRETTALSFPDQTYFAFQCLNVENHRRAMLVTLKLLREHLDASESSEEPHDLYDVYSGKSFHQLELGPAIVQPFEDPLHGFQVDISNVPVLLSPSIGWAYALPHKHGPDSGTLE